MPRSHKRARQKLVIASANPGKLNEVRSILAGLDFQLIPQGELGISPVPENGKTFAENALIKARNAAERSGLPAIADDSGLVVEALGGKPGVYSARYAGPDANDDDNVEKLLTELREVPDGERGAHYVCVAVWVSPDDFISPIIAEGQWYGRIVSDRRGDGGFGYDPVFLDEGLKKTGAEMSMQEKNRQSHRGKAFVALRDLLLK